MLYGQLYTVDIITAYIREDDLTCSPAGVKLFLKLCSLDISMTYGLSAYLLFFLQTSLFVLPKASQKCVMFVLSLSQLITWAFMFSFEDL